MTVYMPEFVKYDAGKLRFDLIDPEFLEGIARILTHGAKTYSPNNWQNCHPSEAFARYYAALQRHLNAYAKGIEKDADTGESHLYHAGCCLLFLAWFERNHGVRGSCERTEDSRPLVIQSIHDRRT